MRGNRLTVALGALALSAAVTAPAVAAPVVTQATGVDAAAITPAVDAFQSSLGEDRRQINWDGGRPDPPAFAGSHLVSAPFFMPPGQFRGAGALFETPGQGLMMSSDPDPALAGTPADVPPSFGNIDPSYETTFAPFSAPRLFTSTGSNVIDTVFVVPGTDDAATTNGFGVVFSDVDQQGPTTIEYFGPDGASLGTFAAPATPGAATFSFLGVRFDAGERIARARITQGTAALEAGVTDVSQGGAEDLVVTDNFLFGEPQPLAAPGPVPPELAGRAGPSPLCATVPSRPPAGGRGSVRLTPAQLLINQRISQAAIRRINAIQAWLDAGVAAQDLCGGGFAAGAFGPGVSLAGLAGAGAPVAASPRPITPAPARPGARGRVTLSAAQLLINQRISQTAVRRLNALAARLNGGLTGGDLRDGALGAGKLAPGLVVTAATPPATPPAATRTVVAPPGRGGGRVTLSAAQLLINQRISQAAVRRSNALIDRLARGLTGADFQAGSITANNLAPELRGQ